jgi:hypothetical protein
LKPESVQLFNNLSISPSKGNFDTDNEGNEILKKEGDKAPLLFVDVNLGGETAERIIVYEGDTPEDLAQKFCDEHNLDEDTQEKLE